MTVPLAPDRDRSRLPIPSFLLDTPPGGVFRLGHRGCCGQYPENTVAAVEAAAPHVDAVEVDVRACGSGELVVFHDETLDRVTAGSGRVDETPFATIRNLDVLGSGEPIPTLDDLLDAMAALPDPPALDVEIKSSESETSRVAAAVVAKCAAADVDVFYSSFHEPILREIRSADPDASLAVVCSERPRDALDLADAVDAVAVHPWKALILDSDATDGASDETVDETSDETSDETVDTDVELVTAAHDRGLVVNAWSGETATEIRQLRAAGVDGVIADRWDVF